MSLFDDLIWIIKFIFWPDETFRAEKLKKEVKDTPSHHFASISRKNKKHKAHSKRYLSRRKYYELYWKRRK